MRCINNVVCRRAVVVVPLHAEREECSVHQLVKDAAINIRYDVSREDLNGCVARNLTHDVALHLGLREIAHRAIRIADHWSSRQTPAIKGIVHIPAALPRRDYERSVVCRVADAIARTLVDTVDPYAPNNRMGADGKEKRWHERQSAKDPHSVAKR